MNKGCRYRFETVILFPLDVYPEAGLLSHVVVLVLIFRGTSLLFSITAAPGCIPTSSAQQSPFLSILTSTCYLLSLTASHTAAEAGVYTFMLSHPHLPLGEELRAEEGLLGSVLCLFGQEVTWAKSNGSFYPLHCIQLCLSLCVCLCVCFSLSLSSSVLELLHCAPGFPQRPSLLWVTV